MILAANLIKDFARRYCTRGFKSKNVQEIVKIVDPHSNIKVKCGCNVEIRPYDLLDCPDANTLRATLSTCTESKDDKISVKVFENDVVISNKNKNHSDANSMFTLEVPVKSNLSIECLQDVSVSDMYSDRLKVSAEQNITTRNLRSTTIDLMSKKGNINCNAMTLAHKIDVFAKHGDILFEKLQGDLMHCKTEKGTIATDSCYVESSKFVTETGELKLKNVHKKCEVYVLKKGQVDLTGFHGNLYMKTNGAILKLHFSEIEGDNIIIANDCKIAMIYVSELIERSCFLEIHANNITLEKSLSHLGNCIEKNNYFKLGREDCSNKLLISVKGKLELGKMSWADTVKLAMGAKDI